MVWGILEEKKKDWKSDNIGKMKYGAFKCFKRNLFHMPIREIPEERERERGGGGGGGGEIFINTRSAVLITQA